MSDIQQFQEISKPQETLEEALLRATLNEHAPQSVDVEQGWQAYQRQLMVQTKSVPARGSIIPMKQRHTPLWARWQVLAAVAAVLVVLSGASLVVPGLLGSSQQAHAAVYTSIPLNQKYQNQGVSISQIEAFANLDQVDVLANVDLPSDAVPNTLKFNNTMVTYQDTPLVSTLKNGIQTMSKIGDPSGPKITISVEFYKGPANPPEGNEIALTWSISQISYTDTSGHMHTVDVNWKLKFTAPFYHDHNGARPPVPALSSR